MRAAPNPPDAGVDASIRCRRRMQARLLSTQTRLGSREAPVHAFGPTYDSPCALRQGKWIYTLRGRRCARRKCGLVLGAELI